MRGINVLRKSLLVLLLSAVSVSAQICPPLSPTNSVQQYNWLILVFSNLVGNVATASNAVNAMTPIEQSALYQTTRYSCIYSNFSSLSVSGVVVSLNSVCLGAGAGQAVTGITNPAGPWEVVGIASNVNIYSSPGWILQPAALTNNSLSATTAVDNVTGLLQ